MSGDEYVLDTPIVRAFVASVRTAIGGGRLPRRRLRGDPPRFARLLADPNWLPPRY